MKYTSTISDKKWLTLGLLSDLGWIAYFVGFALYLINGADGLGTVIVALDPILIFGFGFVIYGALAGFLLTGVSAVIDVLLQYETGMCLASQIMMAVGALVCFAFGLPIMRSFKPEK